MSERPAVALPTPELATDADAAGRHGCTAHARRRWDDRVHDCHGIAIRRSWAVAHPIPVSETPRTGDEIRYDPLACVLLVRKDTEITTVLPITHEETRQFLASEGLR